MGTFFTFWQHRRSEPQTKRASSPGLSVYRRPHYQRPHRTTHGSPPPFEPWRGPQPRPIYAKIHWLAFAASIHILLLGFLATVTLSARPRTQVTVQLLPLVPPAVVPDNGTLASRTHQPAPSSPLSRAEAAFATIQRLDADITAQANRLEQQLVQLAERTTSHEQTIQRQQQALALSQEEKARSAEEVARRNVQEEELAARLVEEQERSALLATELAEHQRQQEAELTKLQGAYNALIADLQQEIANKDITIREANDKLAINIVDRVLFPSGQATLSVEGTKMLEKVGRVLQSAGNHRIQIEGHTDNQEIGPVLKKTFASNWELSTARATEVVKYLLTHSQLPAGRLAAVGRADTLPVAPNTTEEGRQQNRRIEILLLPPEQIG